MKILITGSSGVIGRELLNIFHSETCRKMQLENASDLPFKILAIDRVEPPENLPNVTYITDSIFTTNRILKTSIEHFNADVVIHLAASFSNLEESEEIYEDIYNDDIDCAHAIISWTKPKTFVFASSYLIYQMYPFNTIQWMQENDHIDPRNLCGMSKLYAEKELEFVQKHINKDMNVINARIFRSYGKGSRDIVSRWIRAMLKGEKVDVINPLNSFDYIYAGDVALALYKLSRLNKSLTVNVGTGISTPISEVYDTIFKDNPTHFSVDENSIENTVANVSLLGETLSWTPETTIQEGVKQIIEYERARHNI